MVSKRHIGLSLALWLGATGPALATEPALNPGETLLEIQATGEANAVPDYGQMNFGVVSTAVTAREATDTNAVTMAAVVAAIRKAGVDASFIRTEQINLQPRFARNDGGDYEGRAQIIGYVARNSIVVTLNKLAIAPDVIAAAFGAGANSANGPALQVEDASAMQAAARRDAIAKARVEAQTYADSLGMKIARIIRVSDLNGNGQSDIIVTGSRVSAASSLPALPPLSPGRIKLSLSVRIDYALVAK